MGTFRNRTDLQNLREAAKIAGSVCDELVRESFAGISTMELESMANKLLKMRRSSAPFRQFNGFGHAICMSLNDEIVNAPPSRERILKEGDLVSIAIGSCYRGIHGKAARTFYLGDDPSEEIQMLLKGTREIFEVAVEISRKDNSLYSIISEIPKIAKRYQLSIIKDSGGAEIGKYLHEWPDIPNEPKNPDFWQMKLVPGMAFTLMPMMTVGVTGKWEMHEDGWTHITKNGDLSAHFAETCLMTDNGLELISRKM